MITMIGKGEQQTGRAALRTCMPESVRRRHRKPGKKPPCQVIHRSIYGYAVAGLAVIALAMIWALGVIGCTPPTGSGYIEATSGASFPNARQSSAEVARLSRNAHYYKLMGRPDLALKELEQAHQQNPDNLQIVNALAQGYEEQGHFETARKIYREALNRHGPQPALANNLCFTYYLEGRFQEAETCYRQTLARDPDNEAARNNLGLLYCRLGRQDEARQLWQEAEGKAAAAYKTRQALAALGLSDGAVYAQTHETEPPVREASPPTTVAAVPSPPASPDKLHTPEEPLPLAPQKVAMQLAPRPTPEAPVPDDVKPRDEAASQAPPKTSPALAPAPVPRAQSRPRPAPLTCAELVDTAIEVRNGTPAPHLARQMRSLLETQGFTVAIIGNHFDFGAEKTVVYYRPEAQRVAQALHAHMLPMASLEQTSRLNDAVAVKVLLGHDVLENQDLMARLLGDAAPSLTTAKAPPATGKLPAAPAKAKIPAPLAQAPRALDQKKAAPPQPLQNPVPMAQAPTPQIFKPLTAAELEDTAIEVRNGTRSHHLAHKTRSLLNLEGFTVAQIGNHIDFGAEKTIIYYRPEGQRVALALSRTLFPKAALEPNLELHKNIPVKILLGADLLERPQLMARLAEEQ